MRGVARSTLGVMPDIWPGQQGEILHSRNAWHRAYILSSHADVSFRNQLCLYPDSILRTAFAMWNNWQFAAVNLSLTYTCLSGPCPATSLLVSIRVNLASFKKLSRVASLANPTTNCRGSPLSLLPAEPRRLPTRVTSSISLESSSIRSLRAPVVPPWSPEHPQFRLYF